nr:hypothetical protein [Alicyclobacillus sp. ALC3]
MTLFALEQRNSAVGVTPVSRTNQYGFWMITLGAGEAFLPSQFNKTFLTEFLIREPLRKFQEIHEYHLGIRTFVPIPSLPLSPHFSRPTYESRYV